MKFTYESYKNLINLLKEKQYTFANYHEYKAFEKCVIMRHDIDMSIKKALKIAQIENICGIRSTYFVMLKTNMYNPFSKESIEMLKEIRLMGHDVGLHFDEKAYEIPFDLKEKIKEEIATFNQLYNDVKMSTVSMHRPSKETLMANYRFDDVVNTYSDEFFKQFKYISDSRQQWREPVLDIINSGSYEKLHILTHPFWYNEREYTIKENIEMFIGSASVERQSFLNDNITDLNKILKK